MRNPDGSPNTAHTTNLVHGIYVAEDSSSFTVRDGILADIAPTLAAIAGIALPAKGKLKGRVISEALVGGMEPNVTRRTIASAPAANGLSTILNLQQVGENRYFDAAGFAGRAVGLTPP